MTHTQTLVALFLTFSSGLLGAQRFFNGSDVTGQLILTRNVNLTKLATPVTPLLASPSFGSTAPFAADELDPRSFSRRLGPMGGRPRLVNESWTRQEPLALSEFSLLPQVLVQGSAVAPATILKGFNGLTHAQQRNANNGNQFSVEPPSPSIAVGKTHIVQGVNNALMVYSLTGVALLPNVVSSNEFFVLPAAIDRATGLRGVFPTDMRVFYDPDIDRFVVTQWAQLRNSAGTLLDQSQQYIAVSETGDPLGNWNIYVINTTNLPGESGCPCIPDYPQLGADQYGLYISSDEYSTIFGSFVHASILAISKATLASGAALPTLYRFIIPNSDGFAFAIQPATTPPGASYFLGSGGLEYFVSSQAQFGNSQLAVWAMTNTASLATATPNLSLVEITVPSLTFQLPDVARQRPGPLAYGSTLFPQGLLEVLDGSDTRILSLSYAKGLLFATLQTTVFDELNRQLIGFAYFILSPTVRAGALSANMSRQGVMFVSGNNLLRPSVAVNGQGKGVIAFTLVGPDYFPSAAYVTIDPLSTGSTVQVAAAGTLPEDGFSGYPNLGFPIQGVARWGDYSTAVAAGDGSIWAVTQYITDLPRTELANWNTFIAQVQP